MKEQLIDILGMRRDSTEEQIVQRIREMMQLESVRTASQDFQNRVGKIMSDCNCSREQALMAISQQDAALKQQLAEAEPRDMEKSAAKQPALKKAA